MVVYLRYLSLLSLGKSGISYHRLGVLLDDLQALSPTTPLR